MKYGKAICYSGYRKNQSPHKHKYPTYDQIKQDLEILIQKGFEYIRLYDPSQHAKTVLQVIQEHSMPLKVMLGIDLLGEVSNPQCSWGGEYTEEEILRNIAHNEQQLQDCIALANQYEDIIFSVSAGNEAAPEWNENLVLPERILYYVKELKQHTNQLVTYCDNCAYWNELLADVADEVDFISLHTYPAWTGCSIDKAFDVSLDDYYRVKNHYPDKDVIITEAGWPTMSNDGDISLDVANEENQTWYYNQMMDWSLDNEILLFYFEAFDEPWKGSNNPNEPEKHWGIFFESRKPKKVMK